MDEDKTTTVESVDTQAAQPQPDATTQDTAEQSTNEQPENDTSETSNEPSDDDQLNTWAQAKGIELDSDNAKKLAKMAREAEKTMHKKSQEKSELERNLEGQSDQYAEQVAEQTGQDPELLKRVQRMEVRDAVRDFFDSVPDARDLEADMVKELQNRPHLAGDLEALHALVKSKHVDTAKAQGGKEALKNLAQKQQAAVPSGNATNGSQMTSTGKITPQNVGEMVSRMSTQEYQRRLPEINAALQR